jgi:hypothetical protein
MGIFRARQNPLTIAAVKKAAGLALAALLLVQAAGQAQSFGCEEEPYPIVTASIPAQLPPIDPLRDRIFRYAEVGAKHRIAGLASYYSGFFDGRKTANGEIFRNKRFSAAHLTLPMGSWIEVTARATGKRLRMRVNDRGPYVKKFALDLSQAAARFLGVDTAYDRYVDIRIIALPGEEPLPEEPVGTPMEVDPEEQVASAAKGNR